MERRAGRAATLVVALIVLLVAGCSTAGDDANAGNQGDQVGYGLHEPPVTIDFWYMPNGPDPDGVVRKEIARFKQLHPNITVRATKLEWADALTRLTTAAAGGSGPDVAQLGTTWVGGIAALDALRQFSATDLEGLGGREAFLPASWTATHLAGQADTVAVPWFVDVRAIFYRTDVLKSVGAEPATAFASWRSFEQTLAKIKATGRIAALGQPGKNDWNVVHNIAPFVWQAGGNFLSDDGAKAVLATPAAVDGVNYYQQLVAEYGSRQVLLRNTDDAETAFADGKTAVVITNPGVVAEFQASKGAGVGKGWATAPLPAGPKGRATFLGGSNLSIWKTAEHPKAAYEWVRFLLGEESQGRLVPAVGLWPARMAAASKPPFSTNPAYRAFSEQLQYGRQYPAVAAWTDVEGALQREFSLMWDRVLKRNAPLPKREVEGLLTTAATNIDGIIGQSR